MLDALALIQVGIKVTSENRERLRLITGIVININARLSLFKRTWTKNFDNTQNHLGYLYYQIIKKRGLYTPTIIKHYVKRQLDLFLMSNTRFDN